MNWGDPDLAGTPHTQHLESGISNFMGTAHDGEAMVLFLLVTCILLNPNMKFVAVEAFSFVWMEQRSFQLQMKVRL